MPTYKLYYFPAKGRAEPTRLLFAYKGIPYEDVRVPLLDKWPKFKPQTPYGSLPMLEEDGKILAGSITILRYLAEKEEFNLAGSNAWENAQLASIADFVNDFQNELIRIYLEKDEERKKEMEEKAKTESGPKYLGKLNTMAEKGGYLYGGRLTWPDLAFFCIFDNMVKTHPEIADVYSNLAKLKINVETNPNIAKWLVERPDTQF